MASALGSIPTEPPPGVVYTPFGADFSPAQLQRVHDLQRVPLGAAESVLGKNFGELLKDMDNGSDTTIINYGSGGSGSSGSDSPHGLSRIFANLATMLGWYTVTFLVCDLMYSDFNLVQTLERLPRLIFGPMDYMWQDVLGRPPRGEGTISKFVTWAQGELCQYFPGQMPQGACPSVPGENLELCELECALSPDSSTDARVCLSNCQATYGDENTSDLSNLSKSIAVSQADKF